MKNIGLLCIMILGAFACSTPTSTPSVAEKEFVYSDEILENATIYEANIRQYSREGTFAAFEEDIPLLKAMGVDIIWLMPIHEIGKKKRKGGLGSYYSVKDYRSINPEFGDMEDFKSLLKTAHDNEMYLILDWVANHTSFDHDWITEHPDWYKKDADGEIIPPVADWSDVAALDFDQKDLHVAMKDDMKYWVELGVDGFRCDVAGMVPADFWKPTIDSLRAVKPVFMLAEAWEPHLLKVGFDMAYAWEGHHIMNEIAQGKKSVKDWDEYMAKIDTMYEENDILMNFTSNHDENSWNGTVKERMGNAKVFMAALSYCLPGMPLIYSGQEYDLDHRLAFFEKDTIIKKEGFFYRFYPKLNYLKSINKALDGGKNAASYRRINTSTDDKILCFTREKEGDQLVFIGNATDKAVTLVSEDMPEGKYKDYLSDVDMMLTAQTNLPLTPWDFRILIKVD